MMPQAKTGLLWAGVVVAAALVTGQAEAAGPLAIKCQVQVDVDTEPLKNWALYMGNFIHDPATGELNASLRFIEPATGELGSGSAQLENPRRNSVTGDFQPGRDSGSHLWRRAVPRHDGHDIRVTDPRVQDVRYVRPRRRPLTSN